MCIDLERRRNGSGVGESLRRVVETEHLIKFIYLFICLFVCLFVCIVEVATTLVGSGKIRTQLSYYKKALGILTHSKKKTLTLNLILQRLWRP